jgi:hypothetical protein
MKSLHRFSAKWDSWRFLSSEILRWMTALIRDCISSGGGGGVPGLMNILAQLRILKRYRAAVYEVCERTDAVSWFMSPELGGRDEGLFRPPLSEASESITLDVPDSVSRLCFSKLASLRGWLDTDSDCKSLRRLLFKGSSAETYPLFRPLS